MKGMVGLLVCVWLALGVGAWGNGAPVEHHGISGRTIVPIRNHQIRMVREVVDIDCAWTTYSVQVDFWFKNTTRQPQEVQFGFPVDFSRYAFEEDVEASKQSFQVEWKGKPVKFVLGDLQHGTTEYEKEYCRQWITWHGRFAAGEVVRCQVRYTFPNWNSEAGDNGDSSAYSYLKYILKTGAAWQGPIESSRVTIHYGHSLPDYLAGYGDNRKPDPDPADFKIHPKGYIVDEKKKTVSWEFKNFVPDKDIYFGWGGVPEFKYLDKEQKIRFEDEPGEAEKMEKSVEAGKTGGKE